MSTETDTVRRRAGIRTTIEREVSTATGEDVHFKLMHDPIDSIPALQVRVNNTLKVLTTDYTVDAVNGVVSFTTAPSVNDSVEFVYYWSLYTDDEIALFVDDANGNTTVATAYLLLALAADAARLAKRQTLIGGGGIGQSTIDTSVAAKELRETAKALLSTDAELAAQLPAEGLTTPPWTEANYEEQAWQSIVRSS